MPTWSGGNGSSAIGLITPISGLIDIRRCLRAPAGTGELVEPAGRSSTSSTRPSVSETEPARAEVGGGRLPAGALPPAAGFALR